MRWPKSLFHSWQKFFKNINSKREMIDVTRSCRNCYLTSFAGAQTTLPEREGWGEGGGGGGRKTERGPGRGGWLFYYFRPRYIFVLYHEP